MPEKRSQAGLEQHRARALERNRVRDADPARRAAATAAERQRRQNVRAAAVDAEQHSRMQEAGSQYGKTPRREACAMLFFYSPYGGDSPHGAAPPDAALWDCSRPDPRAVVPTAVIDRLEHERRDMLDDDDSLRRQDALIARWHDERRRLLRGLPPTQPPLPRTGRD
eukprot:gene9558-62885_t